MGTFSVPNFISENARTLLINILKTSPKERYNLEQIKKSKFFNIIAFTETIGILPDNKAFIIDENVLSSLDMNDEEKASLINEINNNKFGKLTAIYLINFKQKLQAGLSSFSDMESDKFTQLLNKKINFVKHNRNLLKRLQSVPVSEEKIEKEPQFSRYAKLSKKFERYLNPINTSSTRRTSCELIPTKTATKEQSRQLKSSFSPILRVPTRTPLKNRSQNKKVDQERKNKKIDVCWVVKSDLTKITVEKIKASFGNGYRIADLSNRTKKIVIENAEIKVEIYWECISPFLKRDKIKILIEKGTVKKSVEVFDSIKKILGEAC